MQESISQPLAEHLRPHSLDQVFGQEHLIGPGKPLRLMVESGRLQSLILWGPPGVGKTTLARILAESAQGHFIEFSAVTSGIADVRKVIEQAKITRTASGQQTILFIDEIHRFNKAQQDAFLPHVEAGSITLIGATTENPGFEVIGPLISRSHVYHLEALSEKQIELLIERALEKLGIDQAEPAVRTYLTRFANGDARKALNAVELITGLAGTKKISLELVEQALQRKSVLYDKKGDGHYDTISAFIKSMRGSDPNAVLHYLARMLEAGEDPMFIARRMVIFASEDVGNALPTALVVATNAMQATHMVGLPEAQLILAQVATYLATAPKSRAVTRAIEAARADIVNRRVDPIPLHLRNGVNSVMKKMGAGRGYRWPKRDGEETTNLGFLPDNVKGTIYYEQPKKS